MSVANEWDFKFRVLVDGSIVLLTDDYSEALERWNNEAVDHPDIKIEVDRRGWITVAYASPDRAGSE